MTTGNEQFLQNLRCAFVDCQPDIITTHFTFPMPFYTPDGMVVFGKAATLLEGLKLYRSIARNAGVVDMIPRIVAQGMPVRGYSNLWVEWENLDADGVLLSSSQVRYVLFQDGTSEHPKIDMVDFTVNAFPEIQQHFPMSATA
jgi:hypothetical protein